MATGLIVLMVAMIACVAFAVDSGRLLMEKRRLQDQADMAALAAGRLGCYIDAEHEADELKSAVEANLVANGFDFHLDGNEYTVGFGWSEADFSQGSWVIHDNSDSVRDAARVTLKKDVSASLFPRLFSGTSTVTLMANAGINKQAWVRFGVGSTAASVGAVHNSTVALELINLILMDWVGVELTALSYRELLSSTVSVGEMSASVGDDMGDTVSMGDVIDVLNQVSALSAETLNTLDSIKIAAGDETLSLADFVSVVSEPTDNSSQLASELSAYDWLSASLLVAVTNSGDVFDATGLLSESTVTALGFDSLGVSLQVTEPAKFQVGRLPAEGDYVSEAKTAQLELELQVNAISILSGLDLGIISVKSAALAVKVVGAQAETKLMDIDGCFWGEDNTETVAFEFESKSSLQDLQLGGESGTSQPFSIGVEVRLAVIKVPIDINISAVFTNDSDVYSPHSETLLASEALPKTFSHVASSSVDEMFSDVSLSASIADAGSISSVLGIVNGLIADVLLPGILDLVLQPLANTVISPLLADLGVAVGEADVIVFDITFEGGRLIE
ncbi:pilus assembly protein TadG-related protein [Photobacterium rosenbergii]|uniref:Pilus assembly protein TadG-related protein n=1 Tax=Photobacterium rosenbergii TaxID=294936 RepID=A0ABU3ZF24_9GAMM|nr:pilus assembly protein TadG-related protein [Photobacterium rosenbergii]MDV5168687.1 pilus assembly protein TadG-related protein [Photobacterium rosenbergii]